jgi:hypothetical protein
VLRNSDEVIAEAPVRTKHERTLNGIGEAATGRKEPPAGSFQLSHRPVNVTEVHRPGVSNTSNGDLRLEEVRVDYMRTEGFDFRAKGGGVGRARAERAPMESHRHHAQRYTERQRAIVVQRVQGEEEDSAVGSLREGTADIEYKALGATLA